MADRSLDVLVFELGGQLFGLAASDVRELVRAVAVVPLPRRRPSSGGSSTSAARSSLSWTCVRAFRLPPKELEPGDHFIVARAGERLVALHVDRAADLVRLNAADLEEARGRCPGRSTSPGWPRCPTTSCSSTTCPRSCRGAEAAALEEADARL